jgi:hypothetical protein
MPIPDFTDEGLLPPGIHLATVEEVGLRLGAASPQRAVIMESLVWAVEAARRAGVARFIVDGSFVDKKPEPNDADCVLLLAADYPRDALAARELEEGFPYVELILFESVEDFEGFAARQFEIDRTGRRRGLVEIRL